MKKYLAMLLATLVLAGCNSSAIKSDLVKSLISAPEVRGIQLTSFSAKEQKVVFAVDLYNPNIYPLPVSGLSGDFQLNQVAVGSMAAKSERSLPAKATQSITLPIQLNTKALGDAAKRALTTREAKYSFNGSVETSVGNLPVTKQGEISVSDILSALLP